MIPDGLGRLGRAAALLVLTLSACTSRGGGGHEAPPAAGARPNILLITAEDLSPRLGAYGDAVAHTPNLDALAAEGVLFTRAFATAGVCAPSRSSLITGVHQQTLGTMHMRTSSRPGGGYEAVPPPQVKAFPELLRRLGYYTVNRSKTDYQFGRPFTVWDEDGGKADWTGRAAGQPFFAMVNFNQTHESFTFPPGDDALPGALRERNARLDATKTHRTDPAMARVPPYYPDTPAVRENIARHYDNVAVMDRLVGRLLDRLEAEGLADETIVLFTTDHGDGLPRAKRTIYDSGTRVPLIVRWPRRGSDGSAGAAGTRRHDLVSFVDIAPTILTLAGGQPEAWMQGRVFLGEKRAPAPSHVFMAADRLDEVPGRAKSARGPRYRYMRWYDPAAPRLPSLAYQNRNPIMRQMRERAAAGTLSPMSLRYLVPGGPGEALYDTEDDPHEVRDLAGDPGHADALARTRAALDGWIAGAPDLSAMAEDAMVDAMWPGGAQPRTAPPTGCRTADGIALSSPTNGASLGWRVDEGKGWALYTAPVESAALIAKAVRYGYAESAPVTLRRASLPPCR